MFDIKKYARLRPMLEALRLETVEQLYMKHKIFIMKQLKNNKNRGLVDSVNNTGAIFFLFFLIFLEFNRIMGRRSSPFPVPFEHWLRSDTEVTASS
ncbi:hypothetical protein BpHYR1_037288 [Brachionus plicatilis]|uniref:Uncharacterized protein n=1 Tax=Brachionus plicatilis TaxID=10195 RepID=A0A3M7R761_BRAPC|nr:hypothetical protein BpHYR1_037288 [Brachionus plicatilis]